MEDQGKRLMLAVVVALAIMLAWNFLFPPEQPEKKAPDTRTPAAQVTPPGSGGAAGQTAAPAGANGAGAAGRSAGEARGPEEVLAFEFEGVRAEFSSWGGVLKSWKLLGAQFHQPGRRDEREDLVRLADAAHRPFAVGFSDGSTHAIPPDAVWHGEKRGDREAIYKWRSDTLEVEKRYRIHPDDYVLELDIVVRLLSGNAKQGLVVSVFSQQDPGTREEGGFMGSQQPREWKAACYVDEEVAEWSADTVASRAREERGAVGWAGFLHSYFVFATAPLAGADSLGCRAYGVPTAPGGMGVDLLFPLATLEAGGGGEITQKLVSYLGPKYLEKLEAVSRTVGAPDAGDAGPGFEKAVDLGWFGFIAGPLLWLLQRFYALAGSWGIAIILLTILVKLATLYWTHRSMKSMKEMAKLRPQLDKLREKYKDDRQKQQVETMNLFKAHGVNPLAGCLPLLLQMPIWFALYRALSVAGELYQAQFLWLGDLTAPDPYFILPIFMTGAMLLQSRLTPTTATGMQQKMLTYGMPLMFGVMGFFFPAGLSLYISTNTVLTLLHHLYMKRGDHGSPAGAKAEVKSEAKSETKPEAKPETKSAGGSAVKPVTQGQAARERAEDDEEGDDEAASTGAGRDVESGKAAGVRNGQRPRGQGRGKGSGRRGGRRKRSSRPS